MIVMILENVPASLRGELSRWLIEPLAGVFVGNVSGMVRDKLWEMVCSKTGEGGSMLIWTTNNEQGYAIRHWGKTSRYILDWDGLQLVTIPESLKRERKLK